MLLRHPYLDWAANSILLDEVIVLKMVTITGHDAYHPPVLTAEKDATGMLMSTQPNATDNIARLKLDALHYIHGFYFSCVRLFLLTNKRLIFLAQQPSRKQTSPSRHV